MWKVTASSLFDVLPGGHYGPSFVTYFNEQNAKIKAGAIRAEEIVVSTLMINKGVQSPPILTSG